MGKRAAREDADHSDVAAQLRAAAERQEMSVRRIAILSNLPRPTVQNALSGGNVTLTTLRALLRVLKIERLTLGTGIEVRVSEADSAAIRAAIETAERAQKSIGELKQLLQRVVDDAARRGELARLVSDIASDARHEGGEPAAAPPPADGDTHKRQ